MPALAGGDAMTGARAVAVPDPLDATYLVEGRDIRLRGGRHESRAAPGAATMVSTAVLGEPVRGDLDGDGDEDAALLLVHDPGGSGTFLYVAAALRVQGRARGTWYFEGDFPLIVTDRRGEVLATGYASATGAWMTEDLVPFRGTIEFAVPRAGGTGKLVLEKDNPSGRRELDDAVTIPVSFD